MFKHIWKVLFFIYLLMILNFIVIKFSGNINHVIDTIDSNIDRRNDGQLLMNLIPFKTIVDYISQGSYGVHFRNILGNIIPFVPMGFLIPMAFPSQRKITKTLILSLLIICSVEILQYVTFLGVFDIDDIILNLLSCFIGYNFFIVYKKKILRTSPVLRNKPNLL